MNHSISIAIKKIINPFKHFFPINNKRIIFESTLGENYECNPKYLSKYLLANHPDKFEIIWIVENPEHIAELKKDNIITTKKKSFKTLYYLLTSKFIVVNHNLPEYIPLKKNQITINTWHGGGSYKKNRIPNIHNDYRDITKFVSSCNKFSQFNLKGTYKITDEQLFEVGMPRNDIFFGDFNELKKKVKQNLGIDQNKKVLLYTPTYRDCESNNTISINFDLIAQALHKRFGGEFVVVCKSHRFAIDTYVSSNKIDIINAGNYCDTQELIAACDVLISDYSSIIWDVSFTDTPCFIYAYDLDEYLKEWDFYTPIETWPFPVAYNFDQLIESILAFDNEKYKKNIERHHIELGSFENGTASMQIADYLISQL